jgi:hypothetical protein
MRYSKGEYTEPNIWDQAKKLPMRGIDPGVRFFVFALNAMGLPTEYSCEGHPGGFYVVFRGPYAAARKVKGKGYFSVEIEGTNRWSLRIHMRENRRGHVDHLRHAAKAWEIGLLPKDAATYIWNL